MDIVDQATAELRKGHAPAVLAIMGLIIMASALDGLLK